LCLHEGQKGALGVLESTQTHVVEESVLERDSRGCFVSCVLFLVRGEKRKMFFGNTCRSLHYCRPNHSACMVITSGIEDFVCQAGGWEQCFWVCATGQQATYSNRHQAQALREKGKCNAGHTFGSADKERDRCDWFRWA